MFAFLPSIPLILNIVQEVLLLLLLAISPLFYFPGNDQLFLAGFVYGPPVRKSVIVFKFLKAF
jgi:hypothetical protein